MATDAPNQATLDHSDLVDSLTVSFLVLLERLNPVERVVFLLADVFKESFADIAETVGRSELACRQIAHRARLRVHDPSRRSGVTRDEQAKLNAAFGLACASGDLRAIEALLTPDAVLVSDGGAKRRAARRPVVGPERVARFLRSIMTRGTTWTFELRDLNGEPGVLAWFDGDIVFALIAHVVADDNDEPLIGNVFILRNPDKLATLVAAGPDPNRTIDEATFRSLGTSSNR